MSEAENRMFPGLERDGKDRLKRRKEKTGTGSIRFERRH